jgi:4-amino-4-deoxy-L-arabinose transferase-like glycosyltransferase
MSAETTRRAFAALLALTGSAVTLAVLAADRSSGLGVILAALGVVLATFGLLDLVGAFDPVNAGDTGDDATPARPFSTVAPSLAVAGGALVLFIAAVRFAVAGMLAVVPAAVVLPAAFLLLVAAVYRVAVALGAPPGVVARRGFWVVAGATLLYLPLLGSSSLIDPWEGHYGEVAREMIARDDWISPWWAQDKWFWSKPVLDLWLEALSMRAFGVHAAAGAVLAPIAGFSPRPEWALRMPSFLFAVTGLYLLYKGVARTFGERAGLLAALVLGTMPQFFLMARQATTDMALVASLTAAMGLLLLGAAAGPRDLAPSCAIRFGDRVFHVGLAHLVLGGAVLAVLPQILYLVSRNLTLHAGAGFSLVPHADVFWSGSPGNCAAPGNAPCERHASVSPDLTPALQALLWTSALLAVLVSQRAERRQPRVAFLGAFLCAAVATMAKGPLGLALPAMALLATLAVTGRLRRLARLPLASGTLLVLAATLPWYVAVFARHGTAFTDELVFRHMIGRATSHLHDTNAGDDVSFRYYLWQLGYASFGWAGLLPAAFAFWPAARPGADPLVTRRQRSARVLALLWVALAFTLFASMPTKFHHYIFPVLPAAALLVGLLLDELLDGASRVARGTLGAAALGAAVVVLLIARDLATPGVAGEARLINLVTYNYQRAWPDTFVARGVLTGFGVAFAAALMGLAVPRVRRGSVLALLGVATAFAVWGLDGYLMRVAPHWGQRELIEAYYRARGSDADPIAAFNLNWKGENFYTGNRVAVFPAGGKILTWVEARRHEGAKSVFFLTEPGRVAALRKEVGEPKAWTTLTEPRDSNKYVLVRATYE